MRSEPTDPVSIHEIDPPSLLLTPTRLGLALRYCLLALLALGASCSSMVEDKRLRELMVEKGFGERARGDATIENYVSGADGVTFSIEPTLLIRPGYEQLALLTQPQQVAIDGTIFVPYVGSVPVLGLTEGQLKVMVEELLQPYFTEGIVLWPRIVGFGKAFYAFGEVQAKGRIRYPKADLTLLEAVSAVRWTNLANLGRVRLIKPDAQSPLVVTVNLREMIMSGNMTWNVPVRNNDILYVPPTLFGALTRFIQKLLEPLNVVVSTLFGAASVRASYRFLVDNEPSGFFFGF